MNKFITLSVNWDAHICANNFKSNFSEERDNALISQPFCLLEAVQTLQDLAV